MASRWLTFWVLFFLESTLLFADPYQVLGVSSDASPEEIKKAYLNKARAEHPDVSSLPKAEAEKRFKEVQRAWEDIQKRQVRTVEVNQDKKAAKEEAQRILESAWNENTFGPDTFKKLPRFKQLNARSPLSPMPNRGAKEEGEWEAIEEFLKKRETDLVREKPETLLGILRSIDGYTQLTGGSVKAIRGGLTNKLEKSVFENTNNKSVFLDALMERLERLNRAGAFLQSTTPTEERERAFENIPELFAARFGSSEASSAEMQVAQALLEHGFNRIGSNRVQAHELGYLIRSIPPALSPREKLSYLADFIQRLGNSSQDLKSRAERAIQQVFLKNADLANEYADKMTFWKKLTRKNTVCDLILGKLAIESGL
ncbi:MAG: hypothetical protein EBQ92_10890 [Proteobacteria bacterium]|nr:hypothetical protein [Pseudomonadota bacterium]